MLRLRTLGGVSLERDDIALVGRATQRRRLALLVYLAAEGDRPVSRDRILALLWPERGEEQARHSLSQVLYSLRADLGADVVLAGIDELHLNPAAIISDVGEFDTAVAAHDWKTAVSLYQGPFLDGFHLDNAPDYEQWVTTHRSRIVRNCGRALEALAAESEARGDNISAADLWRRRVALDPLDARVALRFMESTVAAGDRAGALRYAQEYAALLRRELDSGPDPAVAALAARLRSNTLTDPLPARAESAPRLPTITTSVERAPTPALSQPRARVRVGWFAAAAGIVALLLSAARVASDGRADTPHIIMLGDIAGPDHSLTLAVRTALEVELAADARLRLVPESSVREAQNLMGYGQDSQVPAHVVDDIAQRQGAAAVLHGTVLPNGTGADLLIRLVDPRTGRVLLARAERPAVADDVIRAIARIGRDVRMHLGTLPRDTSVVPLPIVSTTSLPALRSYALARQSVARGNRGEAILLAEAAVQQDSLFTMAHYLLGDLLWYVDQNTRSTAHMQRAFELSQNAPQRERLIVRARYNQLVRDRPDSSHAVWRLLLTIYPNEPLAYEGMIWALRALGRFSEAATIAETLRRVAPGFITPNLRDYMAVAGATLPEVWKPPVGSNAHHAARYAAALRESDWKGALRWSDSLFALQRMVGPQAFRRQLALLALGDIDSGAAELVRLQRSNPTALFTPSALLLQATATATDPRHRASARALARDAFAWVQRADLSPPANARLAERIAVASALAGDVETLDTLRAFLVARDARRGLRSYELALGTVDASLAFSRGGYRQAAERLQASRQPHFFGRSRATIALLEGDALMAMGDTGAARLRYEWITLYRSGDGDSDTHALMASLATARLADFGDGALATSTGPLRSKGLKDRR